MGGKQGYGAYANIGVTLLVGARAVGRSNYGLLLFPHISCESQWTLLG